MAGITEYLLSVLDRRFLALGFRSFVIFSFSGHPEETADLHLGVH